MPYYTCKDGCLAPVNRAGVRCPDCREKFLAANKDIVVRPEVAMPEPLATFFLTCSHAGCGQRFETSGLRRDHEKSAHGSKRTIKETSNTKAFVCGSCGAGYTRQRSLDKHTKEKHPKLEPVRLDKKTPPKRKRVIEVQDLQPDPNQEVELIYEIHVMSTMKPSDWPKLDRHLEVEIGLMFGGHAHVQRVPSVRNQNDGQSTA